MNTNPRFGFVQFHPSYDYTDFVEGLRPNHTGDGFSLQAGTFMEFCEAARNDPQHRYYFLIDEINRGDVSNIFGELFFLLDGGYRNVGITTQYANLHTQEFQEHYMAKTPDGSPSNRFDIPANVTIIGTMNDIDRSVDSFDFAMRRRFRFINITWKDSIALRFGDVPDTTQYKQIGKVRTVMECINEAIAGNDIPSLDADYALGASYFAQMATASDEDYPAAKAETWAQKVKPLLEEYLRGTSDAEESMQSLREAWNDMDEDGNGES